MKIKLNRRFSAGHLLAAAAGGFAAGWIIRSMRAPTVPAGAAFDAPDPLKSLISPTPRITGGLTVGTPMRVPGMDISLPSVPRGTVDNVSTSPINPYAFAEAVLGTQVNWGSIADPMAYIATVLGEGSVNGGVISPSSMPSLYRGFPASRLQQVQIARQGEYDALVRQHPLPQLVAPRAVAQVNVPSFGVRPTAKFLVAPEDRWLAAIGITCEQWVSSSRAEKQSYVARAIAVINAPIPVPSVGSTSTGRTPQAALIDATRAMFGLISLWVNGHDQSTNNFINQIDQHCGATNPVAGIENTTGNTANYWLAQMRITPAQWNSMTGQQRCQLVWTTGNNVWSGTGAAAGFTSSTAMSIMYEIDNKYGVPCTLSGGSRNTFETLVQYAPLINGPVLVNDVIQGMFPDCYFCAGLASVVWSQPQVVTSQLAGANASEVTIRLYSDDILDRTPARNRYGTRDIRVSLKSTCSPLRLLGGTPPLRYHPMGMGGREARVGWSSAFEAAKSAWGRGENTSGVDGCTDIGTSLSPALRNWGSATSQIYGGTPTDWVQLFGADVWGNLSRICDGNGKIQFPFATATLPDVIVDLMLGAARLHVSDIVTSHVYSILGKIEANGRRYVVLRNPWGMHPMRGPEVLGARGWNTLLLGNDGVFALSFEAFVAICDGGRMYGST